MSHKYLPNVKPCLRLNALGDEDEKSPSQERLRDQFIIFGDTQYDNAFKDGIVKSCHKVI